MKGLPNLIRMRRWALDEKRRELAELERLREGLEAQLTAIGAELLREQEAARRSVEYGYSYAGYAMAAMSRRTKVEESLRMVDQQMAVARDAVATAFSELKRFEHTQAQRVARNKRVADAREQVVLDDIGLDSFRRQQAE